jgi:hypothetical protein
MGGVGSGRYGGRPTVEASYCLNIETFVRSIPGTRATGRLVLRNDFTIDFEWNVGDPLYSWIELRYSTEDYPDRRRHDVEQFVYLCRTRPHLGGDRWWFVCPQENRRTRMLYLPLGARRFASRRAHRLGYASQRETIKGRAIRRVRKITAKLGVSSVEVFLRQVPSKPKRMRWSTYSKLLNKLAVAEQVADEQLRKMIARQCGALGG